MSPRRAVALVAVAVYLGSVVLANWLTTHYGFIDVGFGHAATAGTFAAGGALFVRDVVQDALGRVGTVALILLAAGLSWFVANPHIALASGAAFLAAELLDMAAYTPLRRRGQFASPWWSRAVILGALLGAVADSVIFLWIAFGSQTILPNLTGQLLGKGEVVLVLLALGSVSGEVLRQPLDAKGA